MSNFLIAADPIPKKEKQALAKQGKVFLHPADETDAEFDPRDTLHETMQDTAFGAGQGATFNFLDEGYGAVKSAIGDGSYEQNRDEARNAYAEAKQRTPVGTFVGEVGGAVLSPANKLLAGGQGVRGLVQGGLEGGLQSYGATDKEKFKDQVIETGLGIGVGVGTGAISNFMTKTFSKSPTAMRAEVLGVKAKDYEVSGPADRKKIVERIKDTGMLKNRKMEYDVDKMQFTGKSKSKFTLDELEKNTEERLYSRAADATTKLQDKKIADFGQILDNTFVTANELNIMADAIADEYIKRGLSKGPIDRLKAAGKIAENIKEQLIINGTSPTGTSFSLSDLDSVKRMAQEDVKNFSKSLSELGDNEELARITARNLKNLVETKVGNPKFKDINSAQHDFLSIKGDLLDRIKSLELASPTRESYGHTGMLDRVIEGASGSSQGRLNAATMKENYNKYLPESIRAVLPYASEEVPGALLRQKFQGNSMNGNWRGEGEGDYIPTENQQPQAPAGFERPKALPSSSYNMFPNLAPKSTMITPKQMINYRIPRTTQGILDNKEMVMGKLIQNNVPEELLNTIAQALDTDSDDVANIAPLIVAQFPNIFEKSKYQVFDGIIAASERPKAADAIAKREDMNSIQRAKAIDGINKSGKFPQELA